MKNEILDYLSPQCPWRDTVHFFESIDSTNTRAKEMAAAGAPEGTVLIAGQQTGGRGRLGRTFQSPAGMGVYLSVILRPNCPPEKLMHLTCATGVSMCDAVFKASGYEPRIKWTNDLVAGKQKLGGILTELSVNTATALVDYAIIGIGINCLQKPEDFPPELRDMATSIFQVTGTPLPPAKLAAAMVQELITLNKTLLTEKEHTLSRYKSLCITLNQPVCLVCGEETSYGYAMDLDEQGALVVRFQDGSVGSVSSGEVSVRGMYGYT